MFPGGDSKFGPTLLADVPLAPLWLLAQEIENAVEQLLRGHLEVEDGDALVVAGAQNGARADKALAQTRVAFSVSQQQS